jgi:hypothetical protein
MTARPIGSLAANIVNDLAARTGREKPFRGLTDAQMQARDGRLTASRVACLMTGDEAKILNLWRELIGDPAYVAEDLSGVWPVQLGAVTESLNVEWYERKTGRQVIRRGEVVQHPDAPWAAATLDGWDTHFPCPVECKHVGGREPLSTVIDRYQPQLQWQMLVTRAECAALSVIEGANAPIVEMIAFAPDYAGELFKRATAFMRCVESLTPPVAIPSVQAPVCPVQTYDMTGNNQWGSEAASWLENYEARKVAEKAEKSLKALVPSDAARCHGHGVQITRDRAGKLSLREAKP